MTTKPVIASDQRKRSNPRARPRLKMMERQHQQGYEKKPLTADELNIWQNEQVWESLPEKPSP